MNAICTCLLCSYHRGEIKIDLPPKLDASTLEQSVKDAVRSIKP